MPLLRRFLDANSRVSARFDQRKDLQLFARYDADVALAIRELPAGALVVDLGGGRECSFAQHVSPEQDVRIIAVDISEEELAANTSVDETRLADVAVELPFADGEVDLLVSRTLLEHVDGIEAAANNIARVLRPGAQTFHLVPGRYALFAIVARSVRFDLAKRILHLLHPSARGVVEFDVVYDHTDPRGLARVFRAAGFREVETDCTWDQSDYAAPIFPAFLIVMLYQRLAELFRLRTLASYVILRAVR
jgi:ubiquinone/menaquinone biosynthesis C-methylase UbiE